MKFEDLLPKPLHEMTDEEIDEVVAKLEPEELDKVEAEVKKARKKVRSKRSSKKKNKANDEFEKAILQGLK